MKNPLKLDEDEVKILQDFERGELTSLTNFKQEKRQLEKAAHDLEALQKKRQRKGCPAKPSSQGTSTNS